jgi:hypothetical protein
MWELSTLSEPVLLPRCFQNQPPAQAVNERVPVLDDIEGIEADQTRVSDRRPEM